MARDFDWCDNLWAVIKEDGTFAGIPCTSYEEARELANQHENSHVFDLIVNYDDDSKRYPEDYFDGEPNWLYLELALGALRRKYPNLKTLCSIKSNSHGDFLIHGKTDTWIVRQKDFSVWHLEKDKYNWGNWVEVK